MIKTDERFNIDYIDPSGLACLSRCPAKYLFERLMGLRKPDIDMLAADFGTAMHAALPYCYVGGKPINAIATFNDVWLKMGYGYRDEKRNPDTAADLLTRFAETHTPQLCQYKILPVPFEWRPPDCAAISDNEIPFLIDIGADIPLAGRVDLWVEYQPTGDIWVVDYKTSSEISARLFNNFVAACQPCAYTLAGCHLSGKNVKGLAYEFLRVAKPGTKNYCETQIHFQFCNDIQLEQFIDFAKTQAINLMGANNKGAWEQIPTMCAPYACFEGTPGRLCPYRDICDRGDDWRGQIRFYEKHEPFHPFKVNRDGKEKKETAVEAVKAVKAVS